MEIDWLALVGARKTWVILDICHVMTPDRPLFL